MGWSGSTNFKRQLPGYMISAWVRGILFSQMTLPGAKSYILRYINKLSSSDGDDSSSCLESISPVKKARYFQREVISRRPLPLRPDVQIMKDITQHPTLPVKKINSAYCLSGTDNQYENLPLFNFNLLRHT